MFYDNEVKGSIIQGNRVYTSDDVRVNINKIKRILMQTKSMREKALIALALPRSMELIAAIFAALESHITFLPIDMKLPKDRIDYMLDYAEIKYILSFSENQYDFGNRSVINIDEFEMDDSKCDFMEDEFNEVAYLLYTSGSSGRPKAVEVTRRGFNNFLEAIPDVIEFHKENVIACFTNFTFDIFFLESVLALYQGLTIVLADEEEQHNPRKMAALLINHQVDMIQLTPSRFKMLRMVDPQLSCLSKVRTIMLGGEALPFELLKEIREKTNARIYNMYGPTETTIWSSVGEVTNKNKVDIGKPIKDTRIYLLNDKLEPVNDGEAGEICIGGLGLAKGYLDNKELTEKSFCKLPFEPHERIYRTGDMGKYEDGELLCLGRKDEQIKLRGYRIELDDIDSNMMKIDKIKESVTCFDAETERLITFYISNEETDENELRSKLETLLPQYMIPNRFSRVESFCYTASGKIDRKGLLKRWELEKEETQESKTGEESGNDLIAETVIQIAKGVMEDQNLVVLKESRLEEIGMDSINYINMIVYIESHFHLEIEEEKLAVKRFEEIGEIVEYLKQHIAS